MPLSPHDLSAPAGAPSLVAIEQYQELVGLIPRSLTRFRRW